MSSWTDGYVADIVYTHGFYRELTPNILNFVPLAKGQRPLSGPLAYCELGCGQGFSANLLAAANPDIQFHATDFNPTQIANAKALAADAGTPNLHFYDASFEEFLDEPALPAKFDIIALHGIYSWISAQNRRHIVEFIRSKLKPGGLVYVSYNTLPGWAAGMPLRRLLIDAGVGDGPTAQRVETAIGFIEKLKGVNAGFFQQNPSAIGRFDKLKPMSRNYLAHEYFNRDWTTFYFADVAAEMVDAKVTHLGSAHILDFLDGLNLTPPQKTLLTEIADPARRETIRDFMTNQQFRRDVFAKGAVPLNPIESREHWLDTRFALSTIRDDVPLTVAGALGEANLQPAVYDPILDAYAKGPRTIRQMLTENPEIAQTSLAVIIEAFTALVGSCHLQPCLPAKDDGRRANRTKAFNAAVMKRAEHSGDLGSLASPVTGGGVAADRFIQLFLAQRQARAADPVMGVWNLLNSQGQRLIKDGVMLENPDDNIAEIRSRHEVFLTKRLPILQQLGIA